MLTFVRTPLLVPTRTSVVFAAGIKIAVAGFKLRRIVHLDRTYAPAREGSMDVFPRTAILLHL